MNVTTKNYLALGDSYTIGTSVAFPKNLPNQLVDSIVEKTGNPMKVKIVAQNGWRTDDLQRGIKRADLAVEYDLVSLLIGVNNLYQGLPLADFEKDFRSLIDTALKYAGEHAERIFVVSIPNYGYTPFGAENKAQITREVARFNVLSKSICEERGVDYYNVTTLSQTAETNACYTATDSLHPSAVQYGVWVSSFLDDVLKKL